MRTLGATVVAEVYPEGERVTALIIEYSQLVDGRSIFASSYELDGIPIIDAYVASAKSKEGRTSIGLFVVLLLDTTVQSLLTLATEDGLLVRRVPPLVLHQVKEIRGSDGSLLVAGEEAIPIRAQQQVALEAFTEHSFSHPSLSEPLRYSLHTPAEAPGSRLYPLVLFMHDRGVVSATERFGLIQGVGALVWVESKAPQKEPCFVVAVHYTRAIVNDNFEATEELEGTKELLDYLIGQYPVDTKRIYGTGQSMGCMSLMEMGIRYPDFFAGLLLVSGQWDPKRIHTLGKVPLWALVAQDDSRAFQGMSACIQSLMKAGFSVTTATWDGSVDLGVLNQYAQRQMQSADYSLFTVFQESSVIRPGLCIDTTLPRMLQNHVAAWRVVYQLEAVRDWLFRQCRK